MKKEHKDLVIADLCGRLPYKVIVEFISYKDEEKPWFGELSCKDLDCFIHDVWFVEIKPYLFPLSSMTEEQYKEYNSLRDSVPTYFYEYGDIVEDVILYDNFRSIDYLIVNHFDYRGLIPMGLAKDATGLHVYD